MSPTLSKRESELGIRTIYCDVIGYDNYQISDHGDILSKRTGKVMSPSFDKDGYRKINLYHIEDNKVKRRTFRVCRLVAIHFVPNPDNKPVVNHKDCDNINDIYTNLEWSTVSWNTMHAVINGLTNADRVEQLDMNGNLLAEYVSGYEASNTLNIPYNSIRKCCKGNMKQTHGFIFRYKVGDK